MHIIDAIHRIAIAHASITDCIFLTFLALFCFLYYHFLTGSRQSRVMKKGCDYMLDDLEDAIEQFRFSAKPSSADSNAPATIGDINKLIDKIAVLAEAIKDSIQ